MAARFVDVSESEIGQFKEMLLLKKQKMLQNLIHFYCIIIQPKKKRWAGTRKEQKSHMSWLKQK